MNLTTKYLTPVLKALFLGAILASFSLSSVHAGEMTKGQTIKALRMNLWYLGVNSVYSMPGEQLMQQGSVEVIKPKKVLPEELTRALKKANF
jgi:hypothetical protein